MLGEPTKGSKLWRDVLGSAAVIGSAMLGATILYLVTGLLLSVHLGS